MIVTTTPEEVERQEQEAIMTHASRMASRVGGEVDRSRFYSFTPSNRRSDPPPVPDGNVTSATSVLPHKHGGKRRHCKEKREFELNIKQEARFDIEALCYDPQPDAPMRNHPVDFEVLVTMNPGDGESARVKRSGGSDTLTMKVSPGHYNVKVTMLEDMDSPLELHDKWIRASQKFTTFVPYGDPIYRTVKFTRRVYRVHLMPRGLTLPQATVPESLSGMKCLVEGLADAGALEVMTKPSDDAGLIEIHLLPGSYHYTFAASPLFQEHRGIFEVIPSDSPLEVVVTLVRKPVSFVLSAHAKLDKLLAMAKRSQTMTVTRDTKTKRNISGSNERFGCAFLPWDFGASNEDFVEGADLIFARSGVRLLENMMYQDTVVHVSHAIHTLPCLVTTPAKETSLGLGETEQEIEKSQGEPEEELPGIAPSIQIPESPDESSNDTTPAGKFRVVVVVLLDNSMEAEEADMFRERYAVASLLCESLAHAEQAYEHIHSMNVRIEQLNRFVNAHTGTTMCSECADRSEEIRESDDDENSEVCGGDDLREEDLDGDECTSSLWYSAQAGSTLLQDVADAAARTVSPELIRVTTPGGQSVASGRHQASLVSTPLTSPPANMNRKISSSNITPDDDDESYLSIAGQGWGTCPLFRRVTECVELLASHRAKDSAVCRVLFVLSGPSSDDSDVSYQEKCNSLAMRTGVVVCPILVVPTKDKKGQGKSRNAMNDLAERTGGCALDLVNVRLRTERLQQIDALAHTFVCPHTRIMFPIPADSSDTDIDRQRSLYLSLIFRSPADGHVYTQEAIAPMIEWPSNGG